VKCEPLRVDRSDVPSLRKRVRDDCGTLPIAAGRVLEHCTREIVGCHPFRARAERAPHVAKGVPTGCTQRSGVRTVEPAVISRKFFTIIS